ncbi:MAG: hypothetical protein IT273_04265 [Chitinophagales bacterium]|nr:hypothetical protein [Chitinophagales bacterium]
MPDFPNLPNCAKTMECGLSKARASYPINQDIGSWVAIAGCFLTTPFPTLMQKTNIVAHEIGHALGFRHANFGCVGNDELPTIPNAQKTLLGGLIIFGEHQPVMKLH